MELLLDRIIRTPKTTTGKFYVDGEFECYILEDKDRGLTSDMPIEEINRLKVKHQTCIPTGRYKVVITYSNRFKRDLPLLINVPGFVGIRIHPGNTDQDTSGCPLTGTVASKDKVLYSRKAFATFFPKLKAAIERNEEVFITVQ